MSTITELLTELQHIKSTIGPMSSDLTAYSLGEIQRDLAEATRDVDRAIGMAEDLENATHAQSLRGAYYGVRGH